VLTSISGKQSFPFEVDLDTRAGYTAWGVLDEQIPIPHVRISCE
jgi:hypothetical protein